MTTLQQLEQLLQLSPTPMLVADSSGQVLAATACAHSYLGHTPESLRGMRLGQVIEPCAVAIKDAAAQAGAPCVGVISCAPATLSDGSSRVVDVEWRRVDEDDAALFVVSLHDREARAEAVAHNNALEQQIQDDAGRLKVRARELAERTQQLEQRTKELEQRTRQLEHANEQLEGFSYSVSHDLRAPLRAISGFAQILVSRYSANMDQQAMHYLDNIVQASAHMGRLIDDLLGYSRLGQGGIQLADVSLADVMYHVQRQLGPRIEEIGAQVLLPDNVPFVHGTRTLLMQTFMNLIENALTYRSPDVTPRIVVTCREMSDRVSISVTDNGIGIAAEHFERIFEPFQRLHSQEAYPGTGVGLAVVRKALALQNATVAIDSQPGAGTTFTVHLQKAKGTALRSTTHSASYTNHATQGTSIGTTECQ